MDTWFIHGIVRNQRPFRRVITTFTTSTGVEEPLDTCHKSPGGILGSCSCIFALEFGRSAKRLPTLMLTFLSARTRHGGKPWQVWSLRSFIGLSLPLSTSGLARSASPYCRQLEVQHLKAIHAVKQYQARWKLLQTHCLLRILHVLCPKGRSAIGIGDLWPDWKGRLNK